MRIRDARKAAKLEQTELARRLGVAQKTVSRWETGRDEPQPKNYAALAEVPGIAGTSHAAWFLEQARANAGLPTNEGVFFAKVMPGAVAAGEPRDVLEFLTEEKLPLPEQWTKHPEDTVCLTVSGDSMSPLIEDGYIVVVDTRARDPRELVDAMVAAVDTRKNATTIKWLRKVEDADDYMLVPQHTSKRHKVVLISRPGQWRIAGRVLRWIGQPPP